MQLKQLHKRSPVDLIDTVVQLVEQCTGIAKTIKRTETTETMLVLKTIRNLLHNNPIKL